MKRSVLAPVIALYGLSVIGLVAYLFLSFCGAFVLPPFARLALLGVICVAAYFGSRIMAKKSSEPQRFMRLTFWYFFGLYLLLLVTLVCFDSYFGRVGLGHVTKWSPQALTIYLEKSFNLIPFKTILKFVLAPFTDSDISARAIITNILGNLAAFSPFAFFLPLLFDRLKKFGKFLLTMIGIVTLVELLQFALLTGCCDIDDLILNVGGAAILFWVLRIDKVKRLVDRFVGM